MVGRDLDPIERWEKPCESIVLFGSYPGIVRSENYGLLLPLNSRMKDVLRGAGHLEFATSVTVWKKPDQSLG